MRVLLFQARPLVLCAAAPPPRPLLALFSPDICFGWRGQKHAGSIWYDTACLEGVNLRYGWNTEAILKLRKWLLAGRNENMDHGRRGYYAMDSFSRISPLREKAETSKTPYIIVGAKGR